MHLQPGQLVQNFLVHLVHPDFLEDPEYLVDPEAPVNLEVPGLPDFLEGLDIL
jgi:hypothetical protein